MASRKGSTSSSSSRNENEEIGLILVSTDEEKSENEAQCLHCRHYFSEGKRGRKWVRCTKCCEWCHGECAGEREDWTVLAVTISTTKVIYVIFLSNCSFQSDQTC
jgi:hypothetical protein